MKLTDEEMKALYQAQTGRSARGGADCPPEETLARAASGDLSPIERERVADHLMGCADCAQEYRLARSLKPWAGQVAATAGAGTSDRAEHRAEMASPATRPGWRQSLSVLFRPGYFPAAVVAALLIVSIMLGFWIASLLRENARLIASLNGQRVTRDQTAEALAEARRRLEDTSRRAEQDKQQTAELRRTLDELLRPQFNVPIIDLDPRDSTRGQPAPSVPVIEVPAGAHFFTLILHVPGQPSHESYELEVADQRGAPVWRGPGIQKSPYDTFTVALPRRLIPAGQYRIRLYGISAGRQDRVADYRVRVQYR